ncbi:MAG: putative thioredoxin [Planctomycetota bacterium]|jgi:putative thioredoxin
MAGSNVQNITVASFQQDVVERSMQTPVLLDFWADCEPCKQLSPVLEKLATDYHGGFVLGRVETHAEQELAEAFGVQGVPFCVLVQQGRPADGFQGVLPESEIVEFLARNGVQPEAAAPVEEEETPVDPNTPEARFERARIAAATGDVAEVADALSGIPEEDSNYSAGERITDGLAWFADELVSATGEAAVKLQQAKQQFLAREYEPAMTSILESVELDRDFHKALARRAMLLCFIIIGEEDELLDSFRRRLATLLY